MNQQTQQTPIKELTSIECPGAPKRNCKLIIRLLPVQPGINLFPEPINPSTPPQSPRKPLVCPDAPKLPRM